jgi:3-hydroxybutyryl-CoA dehydrogenase
MAGVEKIGIIGAGIMGCGIAQAAAQAGFQVTLRDVEAKLLERAEGVIDKNLQTLRSKGLLMPEQVTETKDRISMTLNVEEAAHDAQLIIEAIPEKMELKKQLFADLDKICPPSTVLASNTSSLSITVIASATKRTDKVIGIHFSNPVAVMKAVELIKGNDTSDATLQLAQDVCSRMGKETYVSRDSPGFIGSRLLAVFINEALMLAWEGVATPEAIDTACKLQLRHPMGPLELADFIGLDTVLSVQEFMRQEMGDRFRPCPMLKQLVSAGYTGRKSGRGIYTYKKD